MSLTADGEELAYIRKYFAGIPMSAANSVTWRGGFAIFILENMP